MMSCRSADEGLVCVRNSRMSCSLVRSCRGCNTTADGAGVDVFCTSRVLISRWWSPLESTGVLHETFRWWGNDDDGDGRNVCTGGPHPGGRRRGFCRFSTLIHGGSIPGVVGPELEDDLRGLRFCCCRWGDSSMTWAATWTASSSNDGGSAQPAKYSISRDGIRYFS